MKISITNWMTGSVLFEGDFSCMADAVKAAVAKNADLRYADLSYADLSSADLRSADLRYADLSYADLSSADLSYADLSSADLSSADLRSADLRKIFAALPEMNNPDAMILASIEKGCKLDMGDWHSCETTHCRAGWYIHHAGPAGAMLEATYGPSAAGAIIFAKAYPKCKVPNFHASNEDALKDIQENAKAHALPA